MRQRRPMNTARESEKNANKGSAGCGSTMADTYEGDNIICGCEIEFTYCAQTSTSRELEDRIEGNKLGQGHPLNR